MKSKVLVTAAHGLVGINLVRRLVERGYEVTALVPRDGPDHALADLPVMLAYGDVDDEKALGHAARGCRFLFHAAADPALANGGQARRSSLEAELGRIRNVLHVARHHGVPRVVLTGGQAPSGAPRNPARIHDESTWHRPSRDPAWRDRVALESHAQRLARTMNVELVVVSPAVVLGAGDEAPTAATALLLSAIEGPGLPARGGVSLVGAREVAEAHVQAAESGRPGQRYVLGGRNLTMRQLRDQIQEVTGAPVRLLRLPRPFLLLLSWLVAGWRRLFGGPPPLMPRWVRAFPGRYLFCDSLKAQQELGIVAREPAAILEEAVSWLVRRNRIANPRAVARLAPVDEDTPVTPPESAQPQESAPGTGAFPFPRGRRPTPGYQ